MTLTEARDSVVYDATMETSLATFEESVFLNIASTRSSEEAFLGSQSAKLGPESIGPAKMLMVSPGDTVDLSVYAKYPSGFVSTSSGDETNIGLALAGLFGATGGGATVYEQGVYNNLNNNTGSFLASALSSDTSTVPKAYLNYVFFDQDFNFVDSKSDHVPVDAGASGAFDILQASGLIMEQAGYLYVYVSNEGRTADGGNVYFDELRINHKKGHILQEDHYYPFGMNINALSSSAPLSKPNQFKYNGKEQQTDFDMNWYDYGARNYDAQLGRFIQVDPMADQREWLTSYNYVQNNPVIRIDPTGAIDIYGLDTETNSLIFLEETDDDTDVIVTGTFSGDKFVYDENDPKKTMEKGISNIKEITTDTDEDGNIISTEDAQFEGLTFKEGHLQEGLEVMEFISFEAEVELSAWGYKNDEGEGLFINGWSQNSFANSKDYISPNSSSVKGLGQKTGHVHTHPGKTGVSGSGGGEPSPADKRHANNHGKGKYPHYINSRHHGWVKYGPKGKIE